MHCKACNKVLTEREQYWDARRNKLNEYCLECIHADNMGLDTPAIIARYTDLYTDSILEEKETEGDSSSIEVLLDNLDSLIFTKDMEVWE